ncbi:Glyoxylase, beta-lactamase superfamily II [Haloechinothrix alba]|uniref:Glyoxylase, beta-lactamase superfamily II n=1 Tax=Haloechinothrix alba TaxID=664784 RepID=A0A238VPQ9_9PSEU|nr:MBL fold metallo-hydrolase [Haloechinothrix alba]SNR36134.1 Glyoxylase, beta-lactamase superfamily II [Haloechinothrix alba]
MTTSSTAWTEPGAHEVAPGVYRMPLPMPNDGLRAVNVYAIEDGDGVVLVDAGWDVPEAREALRSALASLGYELADVRRILATHVHRDHYTLGVSLRREFGMPIALGEGERPTLRAMLDEDTAGRMGELRRWGAEGHLAELAASYDPDVVRRSFDWPDEWIDDVVDIELNKRVLRAVPTPGHTRGHLVFCDTGSGLLFSGDHVLPHITPSIGFEPAMASSPLGDFLRSLSRLRDYADMRLLPAHGPVADSAHSRVEELLEHHDRRLADTARAVSDGARTVYETAGMLGWTRRARSFAELDEFNRFLAVAETAAHLRLLAERGLLDVRSVDGVDHYSPATP